VTGASTPDDRLARVSRTWDLYNAGDFDAALEIFHPDVEVHSSTELANSGSFRGVDELVHWITAWNEAWGSFRLDDLETVPVGEHHAVTRMHQTGIGRGSGVEVSMDAGWLYEIRDGQCVYMAVHPSFEEAIAVARGREGIEADGS
jgi:ketosteroid isomerase-like protein